MMWDNEYDTLNLNKLKAVKEYYEPHTRLNNVNMHHSYCYETWRQFTELDEYEQYVCDWIAHNKCGVLSVCGNEQKSRDCRVASSSQRRDFCSRSRSGVSCSPAANKSDNGLPRHRQLPPDYAGCRKSVVLRHLTSSATLHSTANPAPRNDGAGIKPVNRRRGERERFAEYRGLPLMSRDEFERVNEGLKPAVPAPGMDCHAVTESRLAMTDAGGVVESERINGLPWHFVPRNDGNTKNRRYSYY